MWSHYIKYNENNRQLYIYHITHEDNLVLEQKQCLFLTVLLLQFVLKVVPSCNNLEAGSTCSDHRWNHINAQAKLMMITLLSVLGLTKWA